jgi:hypothetical protein
MRGYYRLLTYLFHVGFASVTGFGAGPRLA